MSARPLTFAMIRELRSIQQGGVSDVLDYGTSGLAFYARDNVIGALERRGLIEQSPDWTITDTGRLALMRANAKGWA